MYGVWTQDWQVFFAKKHAAYKVLSRHSFRLIGCRIPHKMRTGPTYNRNRKRDKGRDSMWARVLLKRVRWALAAVMIA